MIRWFAIFVLVLLGSPALAETGIPAISLNAGSDGSQEYTVTLQLLALMTVLTLLPAFLLGMTAFTRIIIVLAILRQALGTGQTPNNQVLLSVALFLSLFIMYPVFSQAYDTAIAPYMAEQMDFQTAMATGPLCWRIPARAILPCLVS